MTTQRGKRCGHCGVYYWYIASSYGGDIPIYNSSERCSGCQKVYEEALKAAFQHVPRLLEGRSRNIQDTIFSSITKEDIKRWIANLEERRKSGLVAQRVGAPLFDINGHRGTLTSMYIHAGDGPFKGREFKYEYWSSEGIDSMEIFIEMEYDLQEEKFTGNPWP